MSHRSSELDKYINKRVQITFKNGNTKTGTLRRNQIGFRGYCLQTAESEVVFAKTLVKKVKGED